MPCLNCGKDTPEHKLTGCPVKFCGKACRSTWHSREWRRLKGRVYLDAHAAKMRERRQKVQGPKRPRDHLWRGKEISIAQCAFCGQDFQRAKQPNLKVYCSVPCRSRAKKARENPNYKPMYPKAPKPKTTREIKAPTPQKCTGCQWRKGLHCWNPGLPTELHAQGSVSIRESGNCPLIVP